VWNGEIAAACKRVGDVTRDEGEFNVIRVVELVRKHAAIWQIQLREDGGSQGCHVTIPVGR